MINVADKIIKFGGHTIADKVPSLRISKLGRDTLKELKQEMSEYEDRE